MKPRQLALEVLCLADPAAKAARRACVVRAAAGRRRGRARHRGRTAAAGRARAARPPAAPAPGAAGRGAEPLAVHARGPRGAAACHRAHRVQRDQPRARRGLALRRHAARATISTGCAWRARRRCISRCCAAHLRSLGHDYGDFDAHDGLWDDGASRPRGDVLARMALVPRTLEARGLDATPPLQAKLRPRRRCARGGDPRHHPARRNRPRRDRQPLVPLAVRARRARSACALPQLAARYGAPRLKPPFNLEARRAAGFNDAELDDLQRPDDDGPALEPLPGVDPLAQRHVETSGHAARRAAGHRRGGRAAARVGSALSPADGARRAAPSAARARRGCRSAWSRCRRGRAAAAPRAGRRRGSADAWRRHGAACAATAAPSMPAVRAYFFTSFQNICRVMPGAARGDEQSRRVLLPVQDRGARLVHVAREPARAPRRRTAPAAPCCPCR